MLDRTLFIPLAVLISLACESRNPSKVWDERHSVEPGGKPVAAAPERGAPEIPAVPEPIAAELPTRVSQGDRRMLDLAAARQTGAVVVAANDPVFFDRLAPLFDGDITTLSRSEDVNPLVLEFRLGQSIKLAAVRIFPSYSTYDWTLYPAPGGPPRRIEQAAEEKWSQMDLETPVETKQIRLEIRRLLRDNFVHVNEIEFYVP